MKRLQIIAIGLLVGAVAALPPQAHGAAGIKGSPHDFTDQTNFWVGGTTNWVPNNDICEECHTIHKAPSTYKGAAPLWNHTLSANVWTPFTSPQLTADGYAAGGTPGYASLACLSCHDGSIGINQQGTAGTVAGGTKIYVPSWAVVAVGGTDLSGTHPIGIDYQTVISAGDTYFNPTTSVVTDAGSDSGVKTVQQELLFNETSSGGTSSMVECASCHDIHQVIGASSTAKDSLRIGADGVVSTLCLTCHIK